MHLIQIGYLTLSLEHLIMAEDSEDATAPADLPKGVLRLTVESGRVVDLTGALANEARRRIASAAEAPRRSRPAIVGRKVSPHAPGGPGRTRKNGKRRAGTASAVGDQDEA